MRYLNGIPISDYDYERLCLQQRYPDKIIEPFYPIENRQFMHGYTLRDRGQIGRA